MQGNIIYNVIKSQDTNVRMILMDVMCREMLEEHLSRIENIDGLDYQEVV